MNQLRYFNIPLVSSQTHGNRKGFCGTEEKIDIEPQGSSTPFKAIYNGFQKDLDKLAEKETELTDKESARFIGLWKTTSQTSSTEMA